MFRRKNTRPIISAPIGLAVIHAPLGPSDYSWDNLVEDKEAGEQPYCFYNADSGSDSDPDPDPHHDDSNSINNRPVSEGEAWGSNCYDISPPAFDITLHAPIESELINAINNFNLEKLLFEIFESIPDEYPVIKNEVSINVPDSPDLSPPNEQCNELYYCSNYRMIDYKLSLIPPDQPSLDDPARDQALEKELENRSITELVDQMLADLGNDGTEPEMKSDYPQSSEISLSPSLNLHRNSFFASNSASSSSQSQPENNPVTPADAPTAQAPPAQTSETEEGITEKPRTRNSLK